MKQTAATCVTAEAVVYVRSSKQQDHSSDKSLKNQWHLAFIFEVEYLILPTMFKTELCKGFDQKRAIDALAGSGILIKAKNGQPSTLISVSGEKTRLYVIKSRKLFSNQ